MNNQPIQLDLDFTDIKVNRVIRLGNSRAKDSEGRFTTEDGFNGDTETRLREQLYIMRTNYSIWLKNRDTEINELKEKLKKYEL